MAMNDTRTTHHAIDDMLTESAETLLAGLCTPAFVRRVEQAHEHHPGHYAGHDSHNSHDDATARDLWQPLWQRLEASGFLDALVPEARGGSALPLAATTGVLFAFGHHALPLPAAQTMLARALIATANGASGSASNPCANVMAETLAPPGPVAFAAIDPARPDTAFVPYGRVADAVMLDALSGIRLIMLDEPNVEIQTYEGSIDARIAFAASAGKPLIGHTAGHANGHAYSAAGLGALATAATMAGAMQRVLDMTIAHVSERQQFGRPIGKFQAVQQQLSVMAEHVAATRMAVQLGCAAHATPQHRLASAIAKAQASRAAPLVAGTAHALTGAMGITAEYDLQLFTRRLHAQRLHHGAESFWDEIIGAHALAHWDDVARGTMGIFEALPGFSG